MDIVKKTIFCGAFLSLTTSVHIFCHYWPGFCVLRKRESHADLDSHESVKTLPDFIFVVGWTCLCLIPVLEVLDCLSELKEQMEMYKTKVHVFKTKFKEEAHTQKKMLDETQKFQARLQECQVIGGNIDYAM